MIVLRENLIDILSAYSGMYMYSRVVFSRAIIIVVNQRISFELYINEESPRYVYI